MERVERLLPLCRHQVGAVAKCQQARDAIVLLNHRASCDLGRVRGQHKFDAHVSHGLREIGARDATAQETRKSLVAGGALRLSAGIASVIAPAADTVMLLGDVRELQEVSERPGERKRGLDRHLTKQVGELVEVVVVVGRALRERTDPLDACEQIRFAVLLKDTAEQLAQHSDVIAQREVRVVRH